MVQEGQDKIYFVTGEGKRAAEIAPAMEKMRLKEMWGAEVTRTYPLPAEEFTPCLQHFTILCYRVFPQEKMCQWEFHDDSHRETCTMMCLNPYNIWKIVSRSP